MRWQRVLGNFVVVVLAVITIALTVAAFSKGTLWDTGSPSATVVETPPIVDEVPPPSETPSPEADMPSPAPSPKQHVVVFLGDGFIQGIGGGGSSVPSVVGELNGWQTVNLGLSGTGWTYSTTGPDAQQLCGRPSCPAISEMVGEALTHQPTLVVISAGYNDASPIDAVATETIRLLRQQPGIKIVLVSPLYGAGAYPQQLAQRSQELATVASQNDVGFADLGTALAGQTALMTDSVYPNAAGYELIGKTLAPVLANLVATPE